MPGSCLPSTMTDHFVKPGDDGEEHIRTSRSGTASHSTSAPVPVCPDAPMNTRASRRSPRNDSNLDPPITRIPIPSAANASMTSRSQGNTGRVWGSRQMQLGTDSTRVSTSASRSRASGVITKRRSLLAKYIGPAPESAPVTPAPPRTSGRPLTLTVKTDSPEADRLAQAVMPSVFAPRKWTSAQTSDPSRVPENVPDLGAAAPKSQSNFDGMTEVPRN